MQRIDPDEDGIVYLDDLAVGLNHYTDRLNQEPHIQ